MKFKVRITKEHFDAFMNFYNADKKRVKEMSELVAEEFYTHEHPARECQMKMFNQDFMKDEKLQDTFSLEDKDNQTIKVLIDYCANKNLLWQVIEESEHFLHLSFSGNEIFWDKQFCDMVELPNYDAMTVAEIRSIGTDSTISFLPAEMNALSINSINEEKKQYRTKEEELKKMKDDISWARTEELKKIDNEINALQAKLRQRKDELMAELNEKMSVMQQEVDKLNKQIHMMESEIYTIRSYTGETVELTKVRDGNKCAPEIPLIINQKMLYLDEDLARIVSIYQGEIADKFSLFEDAVAGCDEVFESFCPQDRSLTFFRLSRSATYRSFNSRAGMYETEQLIHGKKIGFVLRDGECAYVGWLDETWRYDQKGNPVAVSFAENLMYKPDKETTISDADDIGKSHTDSQNEMLSRVFAMSVIQGILDNKNLLTFPEKVNITKPSRYIVYNFASAWITDDRFGDFATLVENLNKRTKVNDEILICYNKWHCSGRGDNDRAHDCEVEEGINRVNLVESDEWGNCSIYVSAEKRWSKRGATANVLVRKNEYINIAYMNSIWLSYYVQTKKLGHYVEDYAKMIKHFKRAIEILREREREEMIAIKKYYPAADTIPDWQVLLSHWKLNHNIRFITDFQAKRVAKYLEAGKFEENKNLFTKEMFYDRVDETDNGRLSHTNFSWVLGWDKKNDASEFEKGSPYYMQQFYVDGYNDSIWGHHEEENAVALAKELPALELLVPDRIAQDIKKLTEVSKYIGAFMKEHNVTAANIESLEKVPFGLIPHSTDKYRFDFATVDILDKETRDLFFELSKNMYPRYLFKSECWKVCYYDFIHKQYADVLHQAKVYIHNRFLSETVVV